MLHIGSQRARDCGGLSRRSFLSLAAGLPAAWGLSAVASAAPVQEARARSILLVWLWGGPSHLDLFDPKPHAPAEFRGPLSVIDTRTPGIVFSEQIPRLAARSDRYTVIRSNQNFDGDHLIGGSIALTGGAGVGGVYPPNFGSIVARHRGYAQLPPFVSVGRGPLADGRAPLDGYGGGIWGKAYDPFLVGCSEEGDVRVPALDILEGLTPGRLSDRQGLLAELDRRRRQIESPEFGRWRASHAQAYGLLTSEEARRALDLSRENEHTRAAYGQTSFGQSCLLGRRLVEAGVPYVQVNWSQYVEIGPPPYDFGWDTHSHHFSLLADRHGPIFDRALSALIDDLYERGLLETTLLVCMGEFGRTPRINDLASRDHWPQCYFSLWAGAGIVPGRVIGESDPRGEAPVSEPITPPMVGATMLARAGIGTVERAEMKVLESARVIDALF